ncbi:ArnT family glycosyltransferase [Granulicella arctica]|uniref:4-amino-4-deoxy-L-arabinose transferase-like glycosyltransferase n=1 Tax=Granulicella arctica TaxID=940613 RepID=A0A7Y9PK23_9BACT|nr:glycosyltransferase family 39 protein [Granulicella arctica]NYF81301.1 4-amino-4-deoxy-L-arabinose transferase-like glycosyltransferase [Granulicella arctica]
MSHTMSSGLQYEAALPAEGASAAPSTPAPLTSQPSRWNPRSIAIITLAWLLLQIGGLFSPGLLDDVDSIYIEIAREMLHRHDFVTPFVNGTRFFDKPPLMYWMASTSMAIFGEYDWAARLPLALAALALFFSVYALGKRLFNERGGLYSALAVATAIGPYLYTRFFIPDILIALWMTLGVHLFLIALDRIRDHQSPLIPSLGFAAVLALNLLTKGLIGLVFPIGFVLLYLLFTGQLRILTKLHLLASTTVFLLIAAPWHILAALRNPAIPLPAGLGLPATGGWAWFYLYNEHFARFLGKRIPHDYGNTPVWLFWTYLAIWIMPWTTFLPGAIAESWRNLGHRYPVTLRQREAALSLTLWATVVLVFFSISSRQEYYSLPAIPALALMSGGLLSQAESTTAETAQRAKKSALRWTLWLLVPLTTFVAIVCGYFALTAPRPAPGTDIASLLAGNPDLYNLSLGHIFDLTGAAMGLFRAPLAGVALSLLVIGLGSYFLRRAGKQYAANLTLAAAMLLTLTSVHEGLRRFYPILGSKSLALAIDQVRQPNDLILLDGEFTSGSTLVFYTHQQVHLLNGRVNTLWYGSFWLDAPHIFETEDSLHTLWSSPRRIFLLTYNTATRTQDLAPFGPVHELSSAGGKTILTNR